jgi:two-component system sensor histidine kinase HydH
VRVGAGERGVRLPATGFSELDELVFRVNEAASAVEDREDAIMARIRAVQEMARMVAHEVRNPLQSLELLTSLIASEDDETERHELAKAIHAEIRALDLVVTRVLREGASQLSPRLTLHRTTQRVVPIVDQVLALRRPEAKAHGVSLESGSIPDISAEVDGAMLGRSLENLVLNALQAVRSKGAIVRVSVDVEPESFTVFVDDNGPGVDPALGEHVFEANVTGRTGGTGLGLALVREVVQAHGGTIVHERSPLGGARFAARLPLKAPRVETADRPDRR